MTSRLLVLASEKEASDLVAHLDARFGYPLSGVQADGSAPPPGTPTTDHYTYARQHPTDGTWAVVVDARAIDALPALKSEKRVPDAAKVATLDATWVKADAVDVAPVKPKGDPATVGKL